MPNPTLRIGVLTLCTGDEAQLDPGSPLSVQLADLIRQRTLNYALAPDDWVPFNDGTSILRHLGDGLSGFELFSDSASLSDPKTRRRINLFVIDPAALLHPEKAKVVHFVQEHVCSRNDKASCIVIPSTLPSPVFNELSRYYKEQLDDLLNNTNPTLFEYEVVDLDRLKQFLRRVAPLLASVPDSQRFMEAMQVLSGLTGGKVAMFSAPTIGIGSAG